MTIAQATRTSNSAARYQDWRANYSGQQTFADYLKNGPPEVDTDCTSCLGTGIGYAHDHQSRCPECRGSGEIK